MIRPVVGKSLRVTSAESTESEDENSPNTIRSWPNPATDIIRIDCDKLSLSGTAFISIIDFQGREMMRIPFSEQINISSLRAGLYTVFIISDKVRRGYFRLVKTR